MRFDECKIYTMKYVVSLFKIPIFGYAEEDEALWVNEMLSAFNAISFFEVKESQMKIILKNGDDTPNILYENENVVVL